jgi:UDP-N-acetylmuramyl pentapeptide phosphotransferase/UDP-N-acetylglucosamine-1-phosphate transferase
MSQYAPLISAFVTMLMTFILIISKAGKVVTDIPNERSLHVDPIPRVGGVGLIAGVLSGWAVMIRFVPLGIIVPVIILFAISLIDDIKGLPIKIRLPAHLVAAAVLIFSSGLATQNTVLAFGLLLFTVWMTNLYNFMDGSDGLAGGMTFFGFSLYGIAALMHDDHTQAMLNFSIGGAAIGFLYHNFPPAKVFMGDAGSIPLGFLAAAMGILGWQNGHWPLWLPLLAFSPFIVDASVTLLKRTLRGAKITDAHREHYYQRLIQMGWKHRNVAILEYVLMIAAGISALWNIQSELPVSLILVWGAIYSLLMILIDRRWNKWSQEHPHEN